ncbi:DUF3768 domain-containing protein [Scytonema sp. NUACC26]|uniref:DUF3768 domain-containing protein n=1 Tax=Scytonema sp. NUACC26 TaxID=3140176 RepID=UPI0034DC161E
MTSGVQALPLDKLAQLIQLVHNFNKFTPDNNPYDEHDLAVSPIAKTLFPKYPYPACYLLLVVFRVKVEPPRLQQGYLENLVTINILRYQFTLQHKLVKFLTITQSQFT